MRSRTIAPVALLVVLLGACSAPAAVDQDSTSPASASASTMASASGAPAPQVSVDASLTAQLNASDGIIPGSIATTEQELGPECTTAVTPVREFMSKFDSGFSVPPSDKPALVEALNAARQTCEAVDPQQWADFYASEFAGWFYQKVQ
jgi:hypothetical protein